MQEQFPHQVVEVEQVPQGDEVPIVGGGDDLPELSNREILQAFLSLV